MPQIAIYGLIALALISSAAGFYAKIHHDGYKAGEAEVREEWADANERARKIAAIHDAKARAKKEKADAQNAKTRRDLDGLYTAYRSLRDQRNGSLLPTAAPGAASPARASFDRASLDNALRSFDTGVTGLLAEGDRAIIDLDSARKWAQEK